MYLLEIENEDNAVICLRIIIDLHKIFRPSLESEVQPFLDIVQKLYAELPKTVAMTFKGILASITSLISISDIPPQPTPGEPPKPAKLTKSMQSFKVLTESPIIVVLLFQLYPRFLGINISKFMPLIISTLGLQAPQTARLYHPHAYSDFIASQVKVSIRFLYNWIDSLFLSLYDAWLCRPS